MIIKWNTEWQKNTSRLHTFIPSPGPLPPEMTLPRLSWIRLNLLLVLALGCSAQQCTNGAWCPRRTAAAEQKQTADHILDSCPLYIAQMEHLVWRLSLMTLWTGLKQVHSASDYTKWPKRRS